jgi:Flp pilus assembly protein TadD
MMQGEYKGAMDYLELARAEDPRDPDVLTHVAILQNVAGMVERAETSLEQAATLAPDRGKPRTLGRSGQLCLGTDLGLVGAIHRSKTAIFS